MQSTDSSMHGCMHACISRPRAAYHAGAGLNWRGSSKGVSAQTRECGLEVPRSWFQEYASPNRSDVTYQQEDLVLGIERFRQTFALFIVAIDENNLARPRHAPADRDDCCYRMSACDRRKEGGSVIYRVESPRGHDPADTCFECPIGLADRRLQNHNTTGAGIVSIRSAPQVIPG
jgi:hypothetical protein